MKTLKLLAIVIILVLTTLLTQTSCNKENKYQDATIIYKGDPIVDGCGWVISLSSVEYKPINLPTEFQIDKLEVKIKYEILNSKASCSWNINAFDEINIKDIMKK